MNTVYKLQYPTIDSITQHLVKLGKGALLYKIDLSRAFRQLPIDPHDYDLLVLNWQNSYYCDLFMAFGFREGSQFCSRLTDFFKYLMFKKNYTVFTYVDDMVGCGDVTTAHMAFQYLKNLLQELNFPVSPNKFVPPSTVANCLGIIIDTVNQMVSVTEDKQKDILQKCMDVLQSKIVTKRKFQSVIGSLMYIHKCVRPARFFTNRLLQALRDSTGKFVKISDDIRKDVAWFVEFIPKFNGKANYTYRNPNNAHTIAIDASLNRVGGVWVRKCIVPHWTTL